MGLLWDHFRIGIIIKSSVLCLENLGVTFYFSFPYNSLVFLLLVSPLSLLAFKSHSQLKLCHFLLKNILLLLILLITSYFTIFMENNIHCPEEHLLWTHLYSLRIEYPSPLLEAISTLAYLLKELILSFSKIIFS